MSRMKATPTVYPSTRQGRDHRGRPFRQAPREWNGTTGNMTAAANADKPIRVEPSPYKRVWSETILPRPENLGPWCR